LNGGNFILLRSLDTEIFKKTVNGAVNVNVKCRIVDVSSIISSSSDRRRMKLPPFDAARRDGSNELCCILLRSLDAEIIDKACFNFF